MRRTAVLALLVALALSTRLYPTTYLGTPFSTDTWPLVRDVERLLEKTPVDLGDDRVFDGYNNYWPGVILFSAVGSLATGAAPIDFMRIFIPATGSLTVLVVYAIAYRLYRDRTAALAASALFSMATPYVIFTSAATKETFSNPIYTSILLLVLGRGLRDLLATLLLVSTLVISHHLTLFVSIAVVFSIALLETLYSLRDGSPVSITPYIVSLALVSAALVYYPLYGMRGMRQTPSLEEMISLASYWTVLFFLAYISYPGRGSGARQKTYWTLATATYLVVLTVAIVSMRRPLAPGLPVLGPLYILYGLPLLLTPPLALAAREIVRDKTVYAYTVGWLSTVLAIELYSVFGDSVAGPALVYRTLNFLVLPLSLIVSVSTAVFLRRGGVLERAVALALLASLPVSIPALVNTVSGQDPLTSYWSYSRGEVVGALEVSSLCGCSSLGGDLKTGYLMQYRGLGTDVYGALALVEGLSNTYRGPLLVYRSMYSLGFVAGLSPVEVGRGLVERLYNMSLVYTNTYTELFWGP